MLFDQTAPSSAYWTPPQAASGATKTKLALFGYNADGSQNGWGKITSWIPGAGALMNVDATKAAKDAGLTDVTGTIQDDLDNRLQKMQTVLQAGKVVVGAATSNPALIGAGVQGITQGVAGLAQAQDPADPNRNGTTTYRRFKAGGKAGASGVIYDDDDDTEDLHLVDKRTGEKVGEMRYEERIFDQKASLKLEELAAAGDDKVLGSFLRAELATHPDMQGKVSPYFTAAGGGKPTRRNPPLADAINEEQAAAAPFGLNPLWAFQPAQVRVPKRDPLMASYAPLSMTTIPDAGPALLEKMAGMPAPTPGQVAASGAAGAAPATPAAPGTDWLGMGADGLRAITSAIGAAQPLPTRPVNPELDRLHRELSDKQNEGLSAGERVNLLRQQAATQAAEVQAIKDTAGGGGSGAAVLSALNAAGTRADAMGSRLEEADRQTRQQNKDNYFRDLQATQAGSDQLFAQQYNAALGSKNAFSQALGANLQTMSDRQQYEQSYGKGSPYYQLMLGMMKRTGKLQDYADASVTSLAKP